MGNTERAPRTKKRRLRRLLHRGINRTTLTALVVLVQFLWLFWLVVSLAQYAVWINFAFSAISLALSLYIIRRDENPAYKLSWLLVLCSLPLFGVLLYALLSNKRLSRRLRGRLESVEKQHPLPISEPPSTVPPRLQATGRYLAERGGFPSYKNTDVDYFAQGEHWFSRLLEDLETAQHYIFMEYFIIAEGRMLDAVLDVLKRKASEGVDVRIIYDDIGCQAAKPLSFVAEAQRQGIRCLAFNPMIPLISIVMNHRDHRKCTVIDGRVAYTGGINIADEYINQKVRFGHWKDTGLRLCGDAVQSLVYMFLHLWNALCPTDEDFSGFVCPVTDRSELSDGRPAMVIPFSDSPLDDEHVGETVYLEILAQAQRYVYIFTPYLIIDNEMQTALCTAAKRGVDVRIVTPGIPDKKLAFRLTRSYYSVLMRAGVKIYEYTPGFLHAKSFVSDDRVGVVGTINLDFRSLYLHFECATLFFGGDAVRALRDDALSTMQKSHLVEPRETKRSRDLIQRFIDALLRALSPLF